MSIYNNQAKPVAPPQGFPTYIPAGTTWSSGLFNNDGYGQIIAALKTTQNVTVTITRYLESEGIIPLTYSTGTITAGNAGSVLLDDDCPALYWGVTVENLSAVTAFTTNWGLAVGAT